MYFFYLFSPFFVILHTYSSINLSIYKDEGRFKNRHWHRRWKTQVLLSMLKLTLLCIRPCSREICMEMFMCVSVWTVISYLFLSLHVLHVSFSLTLIKLIFNSTCYFISGAYVRIRRGVDGNGWKLHNVRFSPTRSHSHSIHTQPHQRRQHASFGIRCSLNEEQQMIFCCFSVPFFGRCCLLVLARFRIPLS